MRGVAVLGTERSLRGAGPPVSASPARLVSSSRAGSPHSVDHSATMTGTAGPIEEQIRKVDVVIKDCDNSRKNLEQICRRLDDLHDEVKRYRDYLGHEKSKRESTAYKTSSLEQQSPHNGTICNTLFTLTTQLTTEWSERLDKLQTTLQSGTLQTNGRSRDS